MKAKDSWIKHTDRDGPIEYEPIPVESFTDQDYESTVVDLVRMEILKRTLKEKGRS